MGVSMVAFPRFVLFCGLNKSNFKDHYGDATKGQCLGWIAEINVFSASGEIS